MYKEYFKLQYLLINRRVRDKWLPPVVAYPLLATAFIGFSSFLFYKSTFAEYLYVLICLFFISNISSKRRNDFLKICFGYKESKIVRALENLIAALPFIIFLLYKLCFVSAAIVLAFAIISGNVTTPKNFSIVIPTPFYKHPFEFMVGFRNVFLIIAFAYTLTIIAVSVDNFNLGAFSLLLILLIAASFYSKPENSFYVWQFSLTPARFLLYKVKISLWHSFLLCFPVILILCVFYFKNIGALLVVFVFGFAFLSTVILAKYSVYPVEIGIETGILLSFCLISPPLMMIAIPYLSHKSVKNLNIILK